MQLSGKHALVTGGGKGIGAAIARALAAVGARITVVGRSAQIKADVSESQAVAAAFEKAGPVDILVNNAGQAESAPFLKTTDELWRRMMSVNVDGVMHCSRAALPAMIEKGWGRIVNVASTAGVTGYAYTSAYCTAKHAVIGLTRSLALEVATKGITVNAVCPGFTETDMLTATIANIVSKTGRTPEQAREELASRNPQKRLVDPEEVANAVVWLCSPGSEAVTGQSIVIAGGEVMP
jgi:NAD(P)-dependent dehydrogenase (short-subunit alcohol dehydrogenase family)